ncbi:MAG TPA: glycosyltransferase, partial [Myxococcota bacterium]
MTLAHLVLLVVFTSLALLCIWGLQRAVTLADALLRRPRHAALHSALVVDDASPCVTVQVPLFNEPAVCERAVDAACSLAWPRLEVQILDDSDGADATGALVAARVAHHVARGVDVHHLVRTERRGYKAGALAHGMALSRGEFLAVLDADFAPAPDFLARAMTSFAPGIDMVQARWSHHNRGASWLTRAQAALLDAHFRIEQRGRANAGRFFGMNGTAGIWRKSAVARAGGWDART